MLLKNKLLFYTFTLILTLVLCTSEKNINVKIKQGNVSGKVEETFYQKKTYYSFRGVPFAKAPIGDLRFKSPVSHDGWEGTLEAYEAKPTCVQFSAKMRMNEPFGISGTEDCLFLNIFTPSIEQSLPVVVFDYNDNFRTGFNVTDTYSPDFFVEEDVIVVTINHRLSVFGYLTTDDDAIPGNNGLRDFILGLEWIQNNIDKFGGDPKRVTLMGSTGGATLVDILLYSKKASGLFSAAIIQGGTALQSNYFHKNPKQKAFELGKQFNITTDDSNILLEELQNIEITEILEKQHDVMDGGYQEDNYQINVYPFGPVIESEHPNAVLSSFPDDLKVVNDVPVIIGFNSREGLDITSPVFREPKLVDSIKDAFLFNFPIRTNYRFNITTKVYEEAIKEIKKFYLGGNLNYKNVLEYAVYTGDVLQTYAEKTAAAKISNEIKSPLFFYVFDFRGSLNENSEFITMYSRYALGKRGATIGDDLCYLHLCARTKKKYQELTKMVSEQPETKVLKKMVRMWTNFAKTRNPTPGKDEILKGLQWMPVKKDSNDIDFLHITKNPKMKTNPFSDRMQFWDNFLLKYASLAKDGVVEDVATHEEL